MVGIALRLSMVRVVPARPNGACARRRHACQMSVSQCRSPQKPRLLQSHDVPVLRLLCVERSPPARVSSPIKFNPKGKFASDAASSIISHPLPSLSFIHFHQEGSTWNSLVPSWSSPSFRRGTSPNRAITTSRGLPAYIGTKYPGTFLNSQHQEKHVHLPAVLLPVCIKRQPVAIFCSVPCQRLCLPLLFGRGLITSTEPGRYQANRILLLTSTISHSQARTCCVIHFLIGRDPSCPPQLSHQHPSRRILLPGILDHRSCRHGFVTQT